MLPFAELSPVYKDDPASSDVHEDAIMGSGAKTRKKKRPVSQVPDDMMVKSLLDPFNYAGEDEPDNASESEDDNPKDAERDSMLTPFDPSTPAPAFWEPVINSHSGMESGHVGEWATPTPLTQCPKCGVGLNGTESICPNGACSADLRHASTVSYDEWGMSGGAGMIVGPMTKSYIPITLF